MKTSTIPVICGVALAAMSAAGLSHWWSVRQFAAAVDSGLPIINAPGSPEVKPQPAAQPVKVPDKSANLLAGTPAKPATVPEPRQKDFYEALISKMNSLQTQNQDLLDQLAETNRDVMKLEFRVDTHSESFRPLPVTEDRPDTGFEDEPGVLPPRAEPVLLPTNE
jgi:hypothetical protein